MDTVEHYSVIKKGKILSFVAIRMVLGVIVLREVNQPQKHKHFNLTHKWELTNADHKE